MVLNTHGANIVQSSGLFLHMIRYIQYVFQPYVIDNHTTQYKQVSPA